MFERENGVTADFRQLTGVVPRHGCVDVAVGERWGNVYGRLIPEGLGVTGSRSALGGIEVLALAGRLFIHIHLQCRTMNFIQTYLSRTLLRLNIYSRPIAPSEASHSSAVQFKHLNYAYSFQDPIGSYGPEKVEKLREVNRQYDPEDLFQKGVPGGFKLFYSSHVRL